MTRSQDDEKMPSVLDRRIAHANKVITLHNGFETPTTIIFLGQRGETNMKISQKHKELFARLLQIDPNAKIKGDNGE